MTDVILPCNGCTQCCRGPVRCCVLYPDEDHTQWKTVQFPRSAWRMLANQPNGDCVYMSEGGCSTWNNRPRACREYNCITEMRDPQARQLWPNIAVAAGLVAQRMKHPKEGTAHV